MTRILLYLFIALFSASSMAVDANLCANMENGKMSSHSDVPADCHSDKLDQDNNPGQSEDGTCCDHDCISCPHLTTSPVSESCIFVLLPSETLNTEIYNTLNTYLKIVIPPPIV